MSGVEVVINRYINWAELHQLGRAQGRRRGTHRGCPCRVAAGWGHDCTWSRAVCPRPGGDPLMPDPNPSERLAEIEARVEAATPGPWEWTDEHGGEFRQAGTGRCILASQLVPGTDGGEFNSAIQMFGPADANAELIAHAREDIPWLLEDNKRLREAGDKLFAAMPKKSSIWDTFREENIAAMREALEAWAALADSGEAG